MPHPALSTKRRMSNFLPSPFPILSIFACYSSLLFVFRSGQRAKQICQCLNSKRFSLLKADINIYLGFRLHLREPQLFATRPLRVRHLQSAQSWPKVLVERVGRQLLLGYLLLCSGVRGPSSQFVGQLVRQMLIFGPSIFKRIRFAENRVIKFWFLTVRNFSLHLILTSDNALDYGFQSMLPAFLVSFKIM